MCELTELHLLILMNLGDLLRFMEETSVRNDPSISTHTVNSVLEQRYQRGWTHGQNSRLSKLEQVRRHQKMLKKSIYRKLGKKKKKSCPTGRKHAWKRLCNLGKSFVLRALRAMNKTS